MKKLIKTKNKFITFLLVAAFLAGCGKEKKHPEYVARVGNSYLTKVQLANMIDTTRNKLFKSEIIRNWINRELLFKEAQKQGILKKEKFKRLLEDSKKELAAALLVKEHYANDKISYEPKDVEEYFEMHKNDFKLFYDSFLVNIIEFNNEDKAVQFRSTVLESDWNKALNVFTGDTSIISEKSGVLLYDYEINPSALLNLVKELNPHEVSIVFDTKHNDYTLVQVLNNFAKGTIPPFEVIKSKVKERFLAEKKENEYRAYLKDLYSNYDIEVKN